jgi:nucleoside-diphosphate-sugar epimerase
MEITKSLVDSRQSLVDGKKSISDYKILVTGGSGFLGINLIRYLLTKNVEVVSLDLLPFDYPEKNATTHYIGDIRKEVDVEKALKNVDMVVHCAMALPLYSKEQIISTGVDGTKLMLRKSIEHNVKRFVHISSTAVYGIPNHHPIVETDVLHGVGPYGIAKVEAEALCQDARRESDTIVTVLRPKSFIGPERLGVFALFYDWAKTGHGFPMIGSGDNRYQLLDVDDLCDAIWASLTLPKERVNDVFNIGAKEFSTMKEDYQVVLDKAGFGKKVVGLPAAPIIYVLRCLEFFKLSPLYKWVYETASKDSFVSIEKAEKQLNFTPRYSNKDALLRNYAWYLAHESEFKNASGVSHRVPWKQGVLGLAKWFFR